jgi:hypothetical protein
MRGFAPAFLSLKNSLGDNKNGLGDIKNGKRG